jgi:hypothetical protein|tara:strand:- start:1677 stop:2324 length:648 start_codon:yes stop_codon:yes gene_type:complete
MAIGDGFVSTLSGAYNSVLGSIPGQYSSLVNVLMFAVLITAYAIFTWKFYRYISKKDLISLNLSQYNRFELGFLKKLWATILYVVEYVIVLPFLIFFWFGVLALLILVLSSELAVSEVLVVSAAMVAAIRMLAYYEEDLAKDIAKMFPFTILAIFILSPGFFTIERLLGNLAQIPQLTLDILYFLVFIIVLELILRVLDLVRSLFVRDKVLENKE